ncbi:hypothetical protein CYMTET_15989 [Cymbomonas tetramitiformis]|uniref:Uncharacterized protein n=1 Tax=Cymbomonas tetramitiformis TaxID=36881 RepID=A0AAE0GDC1_9CHLO|nr:hypothetical protein CYMTET_15989 [Cymbomonas tetramitiformis]
MERKTKIPAFPRGLPDAVPKHIDAESGEVEFHDDKYEKADVNSFKVLFYAVCVIASVTAGIALGFYLSSGMGDHPSPTPIKAATPKVKVDPPAMEVRVSNLRPALFL